MVVLAFNRVGVTAYSIGWEAACHIRLHRDILSQLSETNSPVEEVKLLSANVHGLGPFGNHQYQGNIGVFYGTVSNFPPYTPVGLPDVFPLAAAFRPATVWPAAGLTAATIPLAQCWPTEQ